MSTSPDSIVPGRGVYEAPYLLDGDTVLIAVDSAGNRVAELRVGVLGDWSLTREALDGALERHEPTWTRPALSLVAGEPTAGGSGGGTDASDRPSARRKLPPLLRLL
jgi:hypothetical protein